MPQLPRVAFSPRFYVTDDDLVIVFATNSSSSNLQVEVKYGGIFSKSYHTWTIIGRSYLQFCDNLTNIICSEERTNH